MAAYRRVYDSRYLQADCAKNRDKLRSPTLGNRVWATFTFILGCRRVRDNILGRVGAVPTAIDRIAAAIYQGW